MADGWYASIDEADVAMTVKERQGGDVDIAAGESHAKGFPECPQRVGGPRGERPGRTDGLRISGKRQSSVCGGIRGHLGEDHPGRQLLLLKLRKQRRVQRAGLVAGGVESCDDHVLAGDREVVERAS